jgi:hypothetical protein
MNVSTASVRSIDRDQAVTTVLLHKLASDDEFRTRLESQPREVFAEYGIDVPSEMPVMLTLPPKDEVHAVIADAIARKTLDAGDPSLFCWFV